MKAVNWMPREHRKVIARSVVVVRQANYACSGVVEGQGNRKSGKG